MKIQIASLFFDIDENLLNHLTRNHLLPFVSRYTDTSLSECYTIRLLKENTLIQDFTPSSRLDSLFYQERDSTITVYDCFSCFTINCSSKTMEIFPTSKKYLTSMNFITDLKLLVSLAILKTGGVLFHSSTVFRNGRALVFLGESGAGKSTIAQLLQSKWTILNDEFNIIAPFNNQFVAYTTPFGAVRHDNISVTPVVGSMFFIKRSIINEVNSLSEKFAVLNLVKNSCSFPSTDAFGNDLLKNIQSIKNSLTIRTLSFSNNNTLVDFIDTLEGNDL